MNNSSHTLFALLRLALGCPAGEAVDLSALAKTYSETGIEMMVLKGYGLSLNYPVPEHRPVGDIDVYLNDNDDDNDDDDDDHLPAWRRGDEIIRRRGIAIDYSHHHPDQSRGFANDTPSATITMTMTKTGTGEVKNC